MTNLFYGSSLFQARKTDHAHRHSHLQDRKINRHLRSHAEFHRRHEEDSKPAELHRRDSTVTEVVQTISVIQVIDGSGATVEVQTVSATPQTNLIDGDTGSTIRTNFKAMSLTSNSAEASTTASSAASDSAIYSVDPVTVSSEPKSSTSTSPTDASSASTVTSGTITSVASTSSSTTSSSFPSLSPALNSTTSSFTSSFPSSSLVSTTNTLPNSTVTTHTWVASSTLFQSSSSSLGTSLSSDATYSGYTSSAYSSPTSGSASSLSSSAYSDTSSTVWSSSYSDSASATHDASGSDDSGATSVYATPSSSSTSASSGSGSSNSSSTTAPTSTVVGGVVGGVAGLALLVAFAFMLVRLRKRGWCHLRLGEDGSTPAARIAGPSPGPSSGPSSGPSPGPSSGDAGGNTAYGTMQRTSPYSVASTLAALSGGKRNSRERAGSGPEMAERGFVRVSGKKLPPVLQFGGDGYTDPRDRGSMNSDASVYRDSMAVFNQPNHQRLALGSPMRPESGVMVVNPGPARTPVTSQAPKPPDEPTLPTLPRSSTFPPTLVDQNYAGEASSSRDGVGRTLAALDESRDGAASRASRQSRQSGRFTEHVR